MFSNFLYFLVALVIYTTSALFETPETVSLDGLYYSMVSWLAFGLVCHFSFRRLVRKGGSQSFAGMDQQVNAAISRLSILALVFFAVNIYGFRLNQLLTGVPLFQWVPTFEALLFLGLFLFYLVLVWNSAYQIQKRYFPGHLTKKSFIISNITFSLPALLPWFCISLMADLLGVLPFEGIRQFFTTTAGELIYILVFLTAVSIFGPVLIQRLWGCRSLPPGPFRDRIEACCRRAGLRYRDILKWELFGGTMITAGVMGIVGRYRYLLVTPALLNSLDGDEIDGVIYHEIGHVRYRHMLFYIFFFAGFIACNFVFFEPLILLIYVAQPLYQGAAWMGISKSFAHPMFICIGLIMAFLVYFRFIFGFFMRHFERQADLHIFNFHTSPSALISTFYKIASMTRQSIDRPNWHHFSIGQRIRFLERCRDNPGLVNQYHFRVRQMILAYVLLAGLLFSLGYSISYGSLNKPFGRYVTEKVLTRQLEVEPGNSDLYVFVGDYFYNEKSYARARDAYENVLRIDPDNVHALNNLAWLLVTCPDERFRDAQKSLALAARALAIKREAFILDTYAEALFSNHRRIEALETARQALVMAEERRTYYQGQVERFKKSL